jgi:hypothetical protein
MVTRSSRRFLLRFCDRATELTGSRAGRHGGAQAGLNLGARVPVRPYLALHHEVVVPPLLDIIDLKRFLVRSVSSVVHSVYLAWRLFHTTKQAVYLASKPLSLQFGLASGTSRYRRLQRSAERRIYA